MKRYSKVRASVRPEPIRFDEKSVWVSENVKETEVEGGVEFEFDQTRYSKNEYIKLIDEKNAYLESQLTDTQLALCEIYEGIM